MLVARKLNSSLNFLKRICSFSHQPTYLFTRIKQKQSLILHSDTEITKMHMRNQKNNKQNQWETINEKSKNKYTVSLIGLPNSGKSTLFNCIIGEPLAIIDKLPGMTRDRKQFPIMDGLVRVIDTPGVEATIFGNNNENLIPNNIKQDIFKQTVMAIHQSDMIILVVDSKQLISSDTIQLVKYIRTFKNINPSRNIEVILACNKCDGNYDEGQSINQAHKLGITEIFYCSGQQGTGIFQMIDRINQSIPKQTMFQFEQIKIERVRKFQTLVDKMKLQMKQLEIKGGSIKQWEYDFRKINPYPETNEDLDYENFQDYLIKPEESFSSNRGTEIKNLKMKNSIKICFVGRPNVGKSSIINELLGEERLVVSQTPHTTRDSITSKIVYKNRKLQLIDTAGLNTPNFDRNQEEYLKKVQISTMLHVKQAHVVIYTMDAFSAFKITDFDLIQQIIKEGRPVIIAINKWESLKTEYRPKAINFLKKQIKENLGHQLHGFPLIFISAKMRDNLDSLLDSVIRTYDKWNSRISTGMLNNWLDKFKKLDNLPKTRQLVLKVNYVIQARVRPPHFIFFVNNKGVFKDNYLRFFTENMAQEFGMDGVPLRITIRSTNKRENKIKKTPKKISPIKHKMEALKKKYNNFGLK